MTTVYECPKCGGTITLSIAPKYPPACSCRRGRAATTMRPRATNVVPLAPPEVDESIARHPASRPRDLIKGGDV